MYLLRFPDGTEQPASHGWIPHPGDIFTTPDGDFEVSHVSWFTHDSCTAILKEFEGDTEDPEAARGVV